ncbi:NAD(P)-dependent oxidoreductase [Ruegeria pomeroyi]|nr:NAD(P)-dependent oxidoreductase [Ruegeria pomeroyi]
MQFPDILVLGATGRIGRILRCVWKPEISQNHILWHTRKPVTTERHNWVSFDPLTEPDRLVAAARGRKAILCLSGVIPGRESPGTTLDDNIDLALAAVRAGAQTGARVLLASSAAVYGNQAGLLSEQASTRPTNAYGRAKLEMEQRATELARASGVSCCCLRIGNIAGIDAVLGKWTPKITLDRFPDGHTPRRSYIGPRSLARVLFDLMLVPDLPQVLNIAAPGMVEMGNLLDAAGLHWTPRLPQPGTIAQVQLDTTSLNRLSPVAADEASPACLVAQWRSLEPDIENIQDSR